MDEREGGHQVEEGDVVDEPGSGDHADGGARQEQERSGEGGAAAPTAPVERQREDGEGRGQEAGVQELGRVLGLHDEAHEVERVAQRRVGAGHVPLVEEDPPGQEVELRQGDVVADAVVVDERNREREEKEGCRGREERRREEGRGAPQGEQPPGNPAEAVRPRAQGREGEEEAADPERCQRPGPDEAADDPAAPPDRRRTDGEGDGNRDGGRPGAQACRDERESEEGETEEQQDRHSRVRPGRCEDGERRRHRAEYRVGVSR